MRADDNEPTNVKFGRSSGDFDKLLAQLIKDLLSKEISSRKNEDHAIAYAVTLESNAGVKTSVDEGEDAGDDESNPSGVGGSGDGDDDNGGDDKADGPRPKPLTKVKSNRQLARAIKQSGNEKLIDLFHSITSISAKSHPLLIAIGVWAFLESCAKFCGANEDVPFINFFSTGKMGKMGIAKKKANTIHDAFVRLAKGGNATKHDAVSADFDFSLRSRGCCRSCGAGAQRVSGEWCDQVAGLEQGIDHAQPAGQNRRQVMVFVFSRGRASSQARQKNDVPGHPR